MDSVLQDSSHSFCARSSSLPFAEQLVAAQSLEKKTQKEWKSEAQSTDTWLE